MIGKCSDDMKTNTMNADQVKDRLVLHFPGYEPVASEHHYQRFVRECTKFQNLWGVKQEVGPLEDIGGVYCWQTKTQGKDWAVSTRLVLMEWTSFLEQAEPVGFWSRIFRSLPRYFAHYLSSAPWRYFAANWRYGLFFLYPVIVTMIIALMSSGAVWVISLWVGGLSPIVYGLAALVIFLLAFRILAPHWKVPLELDLLHHTHSVALQENDISRSRIALFSSILKREIKADQGEEITITTHSFGSVYAVAAIATALRKNPDLLSGRKMSITAIGSNLLQVGLMKQCKWLRDDLKQVLGHDKIQWIEIYAADDPICFYKTGPDKVMREPPAHKLISKRVRFSRMIDEKRYKRMTGSFFRLHRQLIMANDRPYFYDFFLLIFGPREVVSLLQRESATEV